MGTPLYIHDEDTIRFMCNEYKESFGSIADVKIFYASKAYTSTKLVNILVDKGLGMDVVSAGELFVALYSVVSRRDIPGVRSYITVNGGMADNIRPAVVFVKNGKTDIVPRQNVEDLIL